MSSHKTKGAAPCPPGAESTYKAAKSAADKSAKTGIPMHKVLAGATGKKK